MNDLSEGQTQGNYCPNCRFFGSDCNPDTDDFKFTCSAFLYGTDFDFDNDLSEDQTQGDYCPHCQFFGSDCNPDTDDFNSTCSAFKYDTDFDFDSEGE